MDLFTTELPLFVAPFAGIDAIHYLTEIAYRSMTSGNVHRGLMAKCAVSGCLGFVLPISFMLRNKRVAAKSVQVRGLRTGMKRFIGHLSTITLSLSIFGSTYRAMIASTKYLLTAPLFMVTAHSIFRAPHTVPLGIASFCIGRVLFRKIKEWEQLKMTRIYSRIGNAMQQITDRLVWTDMKNREMEWKYVLFGGFLTANLFNFLMDSVLSKYFVPFSFKIRDQFMQQDTHWIYDSYFQNVKDVNRALPREIMYEIFGFAGIEEEYRVWMTNDHCRIQFEEEHYFVQEMSILAHIAFSYASYRELYRRIKEL